MKVDVRKEDVFERKVDDSNRVSLSGSEKVQKARENGNKVEVIVTEVIEDEGEEQ